MQGQITYGQLLNADTEIQTRWMLSERLVHRAKVKMFYSEFGLRIKTIIDELGKIGTEFCVVENDRVKMGEDNLPVLLEGKTREEYDAKINALLSRTCPLA